MNTKIKEIIARLQETTKGEPWYGKSAFTILGEFNPSMASVQVAGHPHRAIDLIYHLLTWTEFALHRVRLQKIEDMQQFERLDWREIDPQIHGWEEAVTGFMQANDQLIIELEGKTDDWLSETVEYRDYSFRTLLEGLADHHIYHLAQINYISKALDQQE